MHYGYRVSYPAFRPKGFSPISIHWHEDLRIQIRRNASWKLKIEPLVPLWLFFFGVKEISSFLPRSPSLRIFHSRITSHPSKKPIALKRLSWSGQKSVLWRCSTRSSVQLLWPVLQLSSTTLPLLSIPTSRRKDYCDIGQLIRPLTSQRW